MKNLLNNILYGRNGIDELGLFTIWVYIVISLINLFTNSFIGDFSALLLVALILFRMLSKNFTARQKENNVFKSSANANLSTYSSTPKKFLFDKSVISSFTSSSLRPAASIKPWK